MTADDAYASHVIRRYAAVAERRLLPKVCMVLGVIIMIAIMFIAGALT